MDAADANQRPDSRITVLPVRAEERGRGSADVGYTDRVQTRIAVRVSAVVGFLAVALGAFGAHGLKEILTRNEATGIWQTAVLYHLVHAVALTGLALVRPFRQGPWWCFLTGVLLFSGSLYGLALTSLRWLGPVTPLGGVFFLVGWAWLAIQSGTGNADRQAEPGRVEGRSETARIPS